MKAILDELIRLNVALEGNLRVLATRQSPEAVEAARQNLDRINNLFEQAFPEPEEPGASEVRVAEATVVKDEEAVGGEEAPEPEPSAEEAPTAGPIVESDADAQAVAIEESPAAEPIPVDAVTAASGATGSPARDLRKAFTLNDKFLFRRELFGGSDQEFSDTIDLLSAMHSLDEAREYLFDDLQWDPKSDVVKDFMDIITNHFRAL